MKVQILCDNRESWIVPFIETYVTKKRNQGIDCNFVYRHRDVCKGDILALLSCERVYKDLQLNNNNLVVHESMLPQGKGWSPVTWQILEGKSEIPVTLFEAQEQVDSGVIYGVEYILLMGHELIDEIRALQAVATFSLLDKFIENYPENRGRPQIGPTSFYPKRSPKDSEIDIDVPLREQFNLLRVCDNNRYPAYIVVDGVKYLLKIEKSE